MSEYIKQAEEFLTQHNATVEVSYLKTDKHFSDDKEKRDIYNVTIRRIKDGKTLEYSFNYGDSIANTKKRKKALETPPRQRAKIGFEKPSAYDILACVQKYEVGDFDNFISDYGYEFSTEREYIKVKQVYFAVVDEYKSIYKLFSDCMDKLSEIQ